MTQKQSILSDLLFSASRVLLRVAFSFEPLAPTAITMLINQQLRRYKEGKVIGNYKTRTKRLNKYHYRIELEIDLNGMQMTHLLANLFPRQLSKFRRWFHE
jgi:hypothetical protein